MQEVVGVHSEESHFLHILQWQHALVLQQHYTLGSRLSRDCRMGLEVGSVRRLCTVHLWRTHTEFQNTAHTDVHVLHAELARLHLIYNILRLRAISRHHQVVACMHLCGGVA